MNLARAHGLGPGRAAGRGRQRRPVHRADRLDAEVDELDRLLATVGVAVDALVHVVEAIDEGRERHVVKRALWHRYLHLVRLAQVAGVNDALEHHPLFRDTFSAEDRTPFGLESGPGGFELGRVELTLSTHEGADEVALDIGDKQAERRRVPGVRRDDHGLHVEQVGNLRGQERPGAAEGKEREGARVAAALDRDLADAVRLVPGGDLEHARSGFLGRQADLGAECLKGGVCPVGVELDLAADQPRGNAAENEVGVGHRRLGATLAVTDGPGIGSGALRTDLHRVLRADPGDGAAAGGHGDDVNHRRLDRVPVDLALRREVRLELLDQADVGRRTARIERQQIRVAGALADERRRKHTRRRPREDRRDRLGRDLGRRDHAAVRLHDQERRGMLDRRVNRLFGTQDVVARVGLDEHIEDRRHRPLVLAVLGKNLGRA